MSWLRFQLCAKLLLLAMVSATAPVAAGHPEGRLDAATAAREPAFEPVEGSLPPLSFRTRSAGRFNLRNLADKVVVFSFVHESCGKPCDAQQELLAEVQFSLEATPMRDMVRFVTVASPGADVRGGAGNWLTVIPSNKAVLHRTRAEWSELSIRADEDPMVFVIGRASRRAGIFHGSGFGRVNMILYINGLTNAHPPEPGFVKRLWSLFR